MVSSWHTTCHPTFYLNISPHPSQLTAIAPCLHHAALGPEIPIRSPTWQLSQSLAPLVHLCNQKQKQKNLWKLYKQEFNLSQICSIPLPSEMLIRITSFWAVKMKTALQPAPNCCYILSLTLSSHEGDKKKRLQLFHLTWLSNPTGSSCVKYLGRSVFWMVKWQEPRLLM